MSGVVALRERLATAAATRWTWHPALTFLVVYLALLLLVPARLVFGPLGAPGTPASLWGIGGLVWWVCVTVGALDRSASCTPLRATAGLLAVAVLASYANGMRTGWYAPPGVRQFFDDVPDLVPQTVDQVNALMVSAADRGLLSVAGWLGVMLVAAEGLRTWGALERVVDVAVWCGVVVGGIALMQYLTGFDVSALISVPGLTSNTDVAGVDGRSVLNRVAGTASHPIEFGVVMACLFPLALHRTLHSWGRRGALVPTVVLFIGSFLSVSRTALLDLGVIGIVMVLGWPPAWRLRALLLAPVAVVGVRLAFPGLVGTMLALFTNLGNDPSIAGRTDDYGVVWDLLGDHPYLGRGLYTFVPQTYRILDNQWLVCLLELGVAGTTAVLLLLATTYGCARSARRHALEPRHRHLGLVLSAAIAGTTVSMVTYDAWSFRMQTGLSFLVLGLAGAAWRLARADRRSAAPH